MIKIKEHDIQNAIRLAISQNKLGVCFRTNVGQAWTGDNVIKNPDGSITIINPRPFKTGLPPGFSDLLIISPVTVSNITLAQASFVEVKTPKGRPSDDQLNFIAQMQSLGARAGVARSVEEAIQILRGNQHA